VAGSPARRELKTQTGLSRPEGGGVFQGGKVASSSEKIPSLKKGNGSRAIEGGIRGLPEPKKMLGMRTLLLEVEKGKPAVNKPHQSV